MVVSHSTSAGRCLIRKKLKLVLKLTLVNADRPREPVCRDSQNKTSPLNVLGNTSGRSRSFVAYGAPELINNSLLQTFGIYTFDSHTPLFLVLCQHWSNPPVYARHALQKVLRLCGISPFAPTFTLRYSNGYAAKNSAKECHSRKLSQRHAPNVPKPLCHPS